MENPGYRDVRLEGEWRPETWDQLTTALGSLGLTAEAIPAGAVEDTVTPSIWAPEDTFETYDTSLVSTIHDFLKFAAQTDRTEAMATRAWNGLARAYCHRARPDHYAQYSWYNPQDYELIPDLFVGPVAERDGRPDPESLHILKLEGLERYLFNVTSRLPDPRRSSPSPLLGHQIGRSVFTFWNDFAAWKRFGLIVAEP